MAGNFLPATYNIKLTKGNTWQSTFAIFKDSVAVNLSGAEVRIQIRRKATSTTAEVTITEADGITVGGEVGLQIYRELDPVGRAHRLRLQDLLLVDERQPLEDRKSVV